MKNLFKINLLLSAVVALVLLLSFIEEEAPPTGKIPECPLSTENSVFFPHELVCNWYFHCSYGVAYLKKCPGNLCWERIIDVCTYSYLVHDTTINKKAPLHLTW